MVNSYVYYTGDGSTTNFQITFDYLSKEFVQVYLDGVLLEVETDYIFSGDRTILITSIPPNDSIVFIRRVTSKDRLVEFRDASILVASDLDVSALQAIHIAEEANDSVYNSIKANEISLFDAVGRRIINVGDPVDPTDACTKGYADSLLPSLSGALTAAQLAATNAEASKIAAAQSATNASTSASQALGYRNTASTHATTATTKASEASTSASVATAKASEASASAAMATTKASEASASASQALGYKDAASAHATTATTKASEALVSETAANTAATRAEQAAANVIDTGATAFSPIVAREIRMMSLGINPSLDLNFTRQEYKHYGGVEGLVSHTLEPFVTFARSSEATYYDHTGLLKTATIDEPRIDYNPATGECKGLLIEEGRTNLVLYSEDFTNDVWVKSNAPITSDAIISPTGEQTADLMIENASTGPHYMYHQFSGSGGAIYTISIFAKRGSRKKIMLSGLVSNGWVATAYVKYDLETGTVIVQNSEVVDSGIQDIGNGWYRIWFTHTADLIDTRRVAFHVLNDDGDSSYAGDGTSGLYIWGAQIEAGYFPTSHIRTEGTAVTRAADNASVTGENFSSWYKQGEGTIVVGSSRIGEKNFAQIVNMTGSSTSDQIAVGHGSAPFNVRLDSVAGGATQASLTAITSPLLNTLYRIAAGYTVDDFAVSGDGSSVATDANGSIPIVEKMGIGIKLVGTANHLNGHISRLTYWPKRLTNTQLQELSK